MRYALMILVALGTVIGCSESNEMKEVKERPSEKKKEVESYKPSQTLDFSHEIHSGVNGIDCKYCHNSVTESKRAGMPTINVCMNCHKNISGETSESEKKIQDIYDAAGWDGEKYTGDTEPIVWQRVHSLPDSVYLEGKDIAKKKVDVKSVFSHSNHVLSTNLKCIDCHKGTEEEPVTIIDEFYCAKCHY